MFKLDSPSKYSLFDAIHISKLFSSVQNSFWTHQFWCLLVLLPFFGFICSTWAKCFPLWTFFIWGYKKVTRGETGWIGRVRHEDQGIFDQKLLNMQRGVGRCAHKSPIMKWANALKKSSKKDSLKLNRLSQQPQLELWLWLDTGGLLEHSSSGGSLYYKGPAL